MRGANTWPSLGEVDGVGSKNPLNNISQQRGLGPQTKAAEMGTKQPFAEGVPIQIPLSDVELEVLPRAISK